MKPVAVRTPQPRARSHIDSGDSSGKPIGSFLRPCGRERKGTQRG